MNRIEIEDFKDMKKVVETNTKILLRIDRCLSGDPDDRKDLGLIGDVRNNLRWKSNVQKTLGALGIGVLTLWIKTLWSFVTKG